MGQAAVAGDAGPEFELCFLEGGGAERRERPASWPGLQPELFLPAREFRWSRRQGYFPGWWWLATTGRHVGYESWLERDHLMLLDFDPAVTAVASQPFWLHWHDGRRSRRHVPDFFARLADGTGVVVDVRADDRIEPVDKEAFEATRSACELAGWGFRRVGVPDPVQVANVAWLARYRHSRCGSPDLARLLLKAFAEPAPLMAGAALAGDPLVVLPVLFHLMWRHVLVADLACRLTAETLVSAGPAPGGAW